MKRIAWVMLLSGCATAGVSAPPSARITSVESEAEVRLDHAVARAGQPLHLRRHVCEYLPPKNLTRQCRDEPVEAKVVRVVDDHRVIVMAPVPLQPSDEVGIADR